MKQLIRLDEVKRLTALSRSTIYFLEAKGEFPTRIALGPRTIVWDSDEVEAWIAERLADRDKDAGARVAKGESLARGREAKKPELVAA